MKKNPNNMNKTLKTFIIFVVLAAVLGVFVALVYYWPMVTGITLGILACLITAVFIVEVNDHSTKP